MSKNVELKEIQKLYHSPDTPKSMKDLLYTFMEIPVYNLRGFAYKVKCHLRDAIHPTLDKPLISKLLDKANTEIDEPVFHLDLWSALHAESDYEIFAQNIPRQFQFQENPDNLLRFLEEYCTNEAYRFSLLWLAKNQPEYLTTESSTGDEEE